MWEEAGEERVGGQCQTVPPSAGALLEAERDVPVCERFQAVGGEGNPGDGGGKGGEDLSAGARWCLVGSPVLVPDLRRDGRAEGGGGQCRLTRATEELGERSARNEPGIRAGREPLRVCWGQGPSGDEIMPRRMGGQGPSPGVEDAHHANRPAEVVRIQRECLQGSRGGLQEQGVHALLGRAGHRPQCLRPRQGDQKGRDRQEECPLPFQPTCGCFMLTRGAMPVLAGLRAVLQLSALRPLGDRATKSLSTALCNGFHGCQVAEGHTVAEAGAIRWSMAPKDVGQCNQSRPPMAVRVLP